MPLHGKIVVIKRSGGDGTEFPLTATCLFGRKPDCDIRIQLPQVSKEHCRIDLNENKEVVLTNLSSVNPTRVNGDVLQQSERLKHGDVITVIDRSFRFEYPPAPTPKKRSSTGGKTETLKVLQDQQVADAVETADKKISEVFTDGTNHKNIQRSLEKTIEVESKEGDGTLQNKTNSPFNDLYQMIKKSMDVKTPRKSSVSLLQTPVSRMCTPMPGSVRSKAGLSARLDVGTPMKDEAGVDDTMKEVEEVGPETPKAVKKQRKSLQLSSENLKPAVPEVGTKPEETTPQKRNRASPQRFSAGEVIEMVSAQTAKSPTRRRSKDATPTKAALPKEAEPEAPGTENLRRVSPRNAGKAMSKKRKSEELAADLPAQLAKRKRVSFGGFLSPELFDKRLPPNSPLQKGAAPRRSLSLYKPKESLLRRASVIGLLKEEGPKSPAKRRSPSPKNSPAAKNASPKTPASAKKSPKARSPSPAKKSPKSTAGSGASAPAVQGRFSVSRVGTPSPVAEGAVVDPTPSVADPTPSVAVTPKAPRRKSIARKTPCAGKVMRRTSVSRASMRVNSWADKVKFGQPKAQVAAPIVIVMNKNTAKKAVPKPQTPARKLVSDVSTGHANSPVTIVVGRAHQRQAVQPSGAAPRVILSVSLSKKNMTMEEDLTGICEIFKTPANARKRSSVVDDRSAALTPMGVLGTPVVEPSVLNTPEETGEMVVSPLNVASASRGGRYNSEAVQRLLNTDEESSFNGEVPALEIPSESTEQPCADVESTPVRAPEPRPEQQQCLTGVKRLMKTPVQKSEPIEDLRGKILKTPKQKAEQKECLTGVKRILKTPRQRAEPVEDIRGNLLVTPKQRLEQRECLTGVKKMFQTPQKEVEPAEDLPVSAEATEAPAVDLQETPAAIEESEDLSGTRVETLPAVQSSPVVCVKRTWEEERAPIEDEPLETMDQTEDQTPPDCVVPALNDVACEEPHDDASSQQIEEDLQVDQAKESDEISYHTEEMAAEQDNNEPSNVVETIPCTAVEESLAPEQPCVDAAVENPTEEQPEATEIAITAVEPVQEKKSVRGRRAKTAETKPAEDKPEAPEQSQDAVALAPIRGRRGMKTEATAPSAARQTTRSRNAKATGSTHAEVVVEESAPQPPKVAAPKPKRGRKAKQASDDEAEVVQEATEPATLVVEAEALVAEESAVVVAEDQAVVPGEPAVEAVELTVVSEEPAVIVEEPALEAEEPATVASEAAVEPEAETAQAPSFDEDQPAPQEKAVIQKKSGRGHRVKIVEETEETQEAKDQVEEPVVLAPVRGRRGKKTEASAPPALRQAKRARNAKSQESILDDKTQNVPEETVEKQQLPEISPEAASDAAAPVSQSPEVVASAAPAEEPAVKTLRGRKRKPAPAEPPQPEENEVVRDEKVVADPQQPAPTVDKPKRGRQKKPETTDQTKVPEDPAVAVEAAPQQPPVRARRGRNAKQEEEKKEDQSQPIAAESRNAEEPAKKSRRTRKTEQDDVEPKAEELQATEAAVPVEAVVQPQEASEPVTATAKPRRGRQPKQPVETEIPESTVVPEAPAVKPTEKPKRSRRGKEVVEEEVVVAPEDTPEPEAEEKEVAEPEAPATKPSRARGAKTSVKTELPAKRARRGAAAAAPPPPEETQPEVTPAEPAKRGRRPKPTAEEPSTSSDPAKPSDSQVAAAVDDPPASKRAVRWRDNPEVFDIPKATPVKAVRGRRAKVVNRPDAESQNDANKPEEKDLSEEVAEAQPAKRARRGAKVAEEAESSAKVDQSKGAEAETQPKTRRGRSAKK